MSSYYIVGPHGQLITEVDSLDVARRLIEVNTPLGGDPSKGSGNVIVHQIGRGNPICRLNTARKAAIARRRQPAKRPFHGHDIGAQNYE